MSTVVAIAGGTGGLGRTITEALKADGRYEILILSRKANPKFEEEYKTRVVDANSYSNVDQLTTILEENNISVVISIFNGLLGSPEELNLIEAADRSRTTKRFIPSLWSGLPFTGEHIKNPFLSPHAAGYQRITEVLRKKSLEFAAIHPGDFMDYYVPLPTHVTIVPLTLSLSAKFAAIPGSGNVPVSFTHTSSISKYIAQLLAKPPGTWQQKYFISDDNKTWNEVVALAEKYKGVKFKVVYDSMEKIRGGKVTEVPGIEVLYKLFGGGEEAKTFVLGWLAAYAECIENGEFHYKDGPLLSEEFGNVVEKLTFEKAWEKVNNNV